MPRPSPRDSNPPVMLPLCDTTVIGPGLMSEYSSTAFTDNARWVWLLNKPIQFGPTRRTPPAFAIFCNSSCIARPSAPTSAKPSV